MASEHMYIGYFIFEIFVFLFTSLLDTHSHIRRMRRKLKNNGNETYTTMKFNSFRWLSTCTL